MGLSITKIAEALGIRRHRVLYLVKRLGIQPAAVDAGTKFYEPSVLSILSAELQNRRLRMIVNV